MMNEWIILRRFRRNINLVCQQRFAKLKNVSSSLVLERPAIDRLLDYIWNQEARKPAIDKLIQEYLESIGSPVPEQRGMEQYPSATSFYPTPLSSGNLTPSCCGNNYDFQRTISTPLLR